MENSATPTIESQDVSNYEFFKKFPAKYFSLTAIILMVISYIIGYVLINSTSPTAPKGLGSLITILIAATANILLIPEALSIIGKKKSRYIAVIAILILSSVGLLNIYVYHFISPHLTSISASILLNTPIIAISAISMITIVGVSLRPIIERRASPWYIIAMINFSRLAINGILMTIQVIQLFGPYLIQTVFPL